MSRSEPITIVGATGLVGRELVGILIELGVERDQLVLAASDAGTMAVDGVDVPVLPMSDDLPLSELVFMCVIAQVARRWVPIALEANCTVIDHSSAFRIDEAAALIVPGVNDDACGTDARLIAVPNCTTIILLTAITPVLSTFDVTAVNVATYQAVSGAGRGGMESLQRESRGEERMPESIFPEPCVGNVFRHESPIDPHTGFNGEETKVIDESHRILARPDLAIMPTCMRVPVERVHTEVITLRIDGDVTVDGVLEALCCGQHITVIDAPTALKAAGGDDVLVGHVRVQHHGDHSLVSLVACGDQLRIGAALTAVRLAASANMLGHEG